LAPEKEGKEIVPKLGRGFEKLGERLRTRLVVIHQREEREEKARRLLRNLMAFDEAVEAPKKQSIFRSQGPSPYDLSKEEFPQQVLSLTNQKEKTEGKGRAFTHNEATQKKKGKKKSHSR